MNSTQPLPRLQASQRYTIEEAARYLKQSRAQTYKQIKTGELRTMTVGKRRYVTGGEIARLSGGEIANTIAADVPGAIAKERRELWRTAWMTCFERLLDAELATKKADSVVSDYLSRFSSDSA